MGGFHIVICMLRTIYSFYQNSGLVQILSTAGLGGLGTIKKALKGGDVNEAIRLHKKLFEAILRTKISYIDVSQPQNNDEKKNVLMKLTEEVSFKSMESVMDSSVVKPLPNGQEIRLGSWTFIWRWLTCCSIISIFSELGIGMGTWKCGTSFYRIVSDLIDITMLVI